MTFRWWPALLLGVAIVPGFQAGAQFLPPTDYGFSLPRVAVAGLRPSRDCDTSLPTFGYPDHQYWAPQGKIAMSNDGGWCWVQFGQVSHSLQFVPNATIVAQPANGQVTLEKMSDRVSVAYRPSPGFSGSDQFAVRTEGPHPQTIPFAVIVR